MNSAPGCAGSVPDRAAVFARIAAPVQRAVLVVDEDRLISTERTGRAIQVMALLPERFESCLGNSGFRPDAASLGGHRPAGGRLRTEMLNTRRIARLLNVHPEIDHV